MIDEHDVREMLLRRAHTVPAAPADTPTAVRRGRRRLVLNGAVATVAAAAIVVATFAGVEAIRSAPIPADEPTPTGIFAPVTGRIIYENEGNDLGYGRGLWAVDPSGPSDTAAGPTVAEDVASMLVRLDLQEATPLDWSSDGTELLFSRPDAASAESLFPMGNLYILHADGSETLLNRDPMSFGGATISPDGTRVVFAAWGDALGLWVVDADGGRPVRLPLPGAEGIVADPTFSHDGTQIAYVDSGDPENHLWVMDADGSNAHEILANEPTLVGGAGNLQWSPAGDRIAIQVRAPDPDGTNAIYTFAPDGSDFRQIITGGLSPYWSPDGSQIAYTIECELSDTSCGGLVIADADGSNVRAFGFAASGPWHPGASVQIDETTPDPGDSFARADGDVLSFTGTSDAPGDLVAVDPESGDARVLVEGLDNVLSATWSADGRWIAYETAPGYPEVTPGGAVTYELWVVGGSQEPRLIHTGSNIFVGSGSLGWTWSRTGAQLLWARLSGDPFIERSKPTVIDFETGETTVLDPIDGYVGLRPEWSPDGTRIVFASGKGAVYSVDLGSGERSLLARLPDLGVDSAAEIQWSPDGAHIAIDAGATLYVMDADGSDVRLLTEGYDPLGVAWSADGTRLAFAQGSPADGEIRIWVASMDGTDPTEIGSVALVACPFNCDMTWSPDGSQVAVWKLEGEASAIAADGSEAEPIDELTYRSWDGGSYSCGCWGPG